MSIRAWCEACGINRQQFFYWQRKLRAAACEQLAWGQDTVDQRKLCAVSGFAEVKLAEAAVHQPAVLAAEIRIEVGGVRIAADSGYPPEELARLLRELLKPC